MRVGFHPLVQRDANEISRRYETSSLRAADNFWRELNETIEDIERNPYRFPSYYKDLRRANLERFPFHLLYRILPDRVRITAIRHHKRHPRTALRRV
jgi:plasmid stabilization system protein ParE